MANPFKLVDFTAREEILAGDLVRMQKLGHKALQDELLNAGIDSTGTFIASFSAVPTVAASGSFNETIGVGEALTFDASGVTADDSSLHVLQWPQQDLTFANPDPTNPRIDLIVALPAQVDGDVQSRNVLVDPVLRTVNPANVAKTNSPTATLSVVTGTPGATPAPPAVPAGKVAFFEVYVPAAAASSANFVVIPRLFRRAPYPFTGTNGVSPRLAESGIFRGCTISYSGTTPSVSSSNNVVLIDGELIEFGSGANVVNDSLNDPTAVAAPGGNDKPFYFWLVGGRNLPSAGGTSNVNPVELIASLTAPDTVTGRPPTPLGASRGTTSSACYIGVGFIRKGTTTPQPVRYRGDVVWLGSTTGDNGFEDQAIPTSGTITFPSAPAIANVVQFIIGNIAGACVFTATLPGLPSAVALVAANYGGATSHDGPYEMPISAGGPHISVVETGTLNLRPIAYKMNVRRFG
jgi:hypothetical protein